MLILLLFCAARSFAAAAVLAIYFTGSEKDSR
jgi:hypothetical protein